MTEGLARSFEPNSSLVNYLGPSVPNFSQERELASLLKPNEDFAGKKLFHISDLITAYNRKNIRGGSHQNLLLFIKQSESLFRFLYYFRKRALAHYLRDLKTHIPVRQKHMTLQNKSRFFLLFVKHFGPIQPLFKQWKKWVFTQSMIHP